MIDLHCHILPGIDDGPPDMDGTLALARAHSAAGVRTVLATPHVTWDLPGNDAATIGAGAEAVNGALAAEGIALEVLTGAEIALTRAADLDDAELAALALGDGPWLLVESPLHPSATGFEGVLHHLQDRGHRVLLAHPERCPAFQREPDKLVDCVRAGMLTSITAGALVGRFGSTVERFARRLVAEGLVHNVASDAHDAVRRAPGMSAEIEQAGLGARLAWWTEEVPAALLAGAAIPVAPALELVPEPRGRLRSLFGR